MGIHQVSLDGFVEVHHFVEISPHPEAIEVDRFQHPVGVVVLPVQMAECREDSLMSSILAVFRRRGMSEIFRCQSSRFV
jgi:hypothetical protein